MGKSKFPGKPSKSQHKKHVSVLTGEVICEGDVSFKTEGASDRLSVLQKTFGEQEEQTGEVTESSKLTSTAPSPECQNENVIGPEIEMPKECIRVPKFSARIKNRQKNEKTDEIAAEKQGNNKKCKKSVTFRSVLESYSDSVGSKRKSPFNHDLPLVSIIKKNFSQYKCDSIVKPSKLTDISAKFAINSKSIFNQKADVKADKDKEFSGAVGGFALPVRSVHSSRVIKPNKRFIETEQPGVTDTTKLVIKKPRLPISNDEAYETCDSSSPHSNDPGDDCHDNNNAEGESMGKFLWHTLRPNVDKQMFSKKMPKSKKAEMENQSEQSDPSTDSDDSQDILTSEDEDEETGDSGSEMDVNAKRVVQNSLPQVTIPSAGKNILRKARLQLQDTVPVGNEGPFSASIINNNNSVVSPPGTVTCGVCGAVRFYRFVRQARKFGIYSCESCRKFISKMVKKQAVISLSSEPTVLHCHKGDGLCHVPPIVRSSQWKLLRCAYKARCPACWLKLCLRSFQMPPALQSRLIATLPMNMRETALQNLPKLETENNPSMAKLFPSRLNLLGSDVDSNNQKLLDITAGKRVPRWSQENGDRLDINLQETILDEMSDIIKSSESEKSAQELDIEKESKLADKKRKHMNVRVRKKPETGLETKPVVQSTADSSKRQRIDLKGPRVKHVCRSASIVLGQPIATFSNETDAETISLEISEAGSSPPQTVPEMKEEEKNPDSESIFKDISETIAVPKDIVNDTSEELQTSENVSISIEENKSLHIDVKPDILENINVKDNNNVPVETHDKLITVSEVKTATKTTKPVIAENTIAVKKPIRNLNSVSYNTGKKMSSTLTNPISVDFWENYDPVEVSRTGFGLIGFDFLNVLSLCFLCGASGTGEDQMIYCSCCCEPYHRYCVEDNIVNYNSNNGLDVTENSMFDISISSLSPYQNGMWRLNWLCPRCTVCQSCGSVTGTKLSCRKCHRSYHSTCVNTKNSKRIIGSDRPWICPPCLKCKSCGSSSVAKYIGNMPLCISCFKLRQKGSYCPLCQKCYEDNDYNTKMMECGDCKRWIHAHCEGLSDEKYELLSILPESIEFICRKCHIETNPGWREAIDVELKNGFQSILRALSKNRDACALLKWSPRKKTLCSCQPITFAKNMKFQGTNSDTICEKLSELTSNDGWLDKENSKNNDEQKAMDVELQNAVSSIEISESWKQETEDEQNAITKEANNICSICNCDKIATQVPSLLDIKRKVICNEYTSLSDFNNDMLAAIDLTKCEDLHNIYNDIVHDCFPWFTNNVSEIEEKISEDELKQKNSGETFMSTENKDTSDQQVPCDSILFDGDNYFYDDHIPELDLRLCLLCKGTGDGLPSHESRLLYCGHNEWVHANCALWSAEVFEEIDGSLQNVHSAVSRGKLIRCAHCNMKGASVGCCARNCSITFHFPCAKNFGCAFMDDKTVYCPSHISENAGNKSQQHDKDFEINRPVYVELDRKKKRLIEANHVQFLVGSLRVKNLGKFISILSDTSEAIIPLNFTCTRMFWSTKEPWKIIEYTIKTSVFIKKPHISNALERNFTVDHSQENAVVQCNLNEIIKFHKSIDDGDQTPDQSPQKNNTLTKAKFQTLPEEKTVKIVLDQLLDTVCNYEEEICDEEPQNTADLLSPELEDEIYEDLQRDLLDGISMLDLFPKLMNYEDFVMDGNSNRDLLKDKDEATESRFDILGKVRKDVDNNQNDSWFDCKTSDLIDDLFPTSKNSRITRELKRSKSEVLPYTKKVLTTGNRAHQRSCSLTWSCKLDGNVNFKRRKMAQNRNLNPYSGDISQFYQELKKPEAMIKYSSRENTTKNEPNKSLASTESCSLQEDESPFTNDIKSAALDKIKISQLDGADDASDGSEYGSPPHQIIEEFRSNEQVYHTTYIEQTSNELPVKCERCHCTYRTHDSYQRHLASCESLTSESESELSHSPEVRQEAISINPEGVMIMQNITTTNTFVPEQQNVQNISMQMSNMQNHQAPISIVPNFNMTGNQITFNNTMIQNGGTNNPVISYDCSNNMQNVMIAPGQTNIQFGQTSKSVFTHPQTIHIDHNQRQQQNIIQSEQNITAQFQQNQSHIYPMSLANQIQNNPQILQAMPNNITINQLQQHPTIVKAQNSINYQTCQMPQQNQNTNQPRIITFTNPQQILTSQNSSQMQPFTIGQNGPILNFTMNQPMANSPQKKQLILPQTMKSPPKRQAIVRMPAANNRSRSKTSPRMNNTNKRAIRPDKPIMSNQGIQLNRPMVIQQSQNQNPSIIVQQLSNPNVMSYVEALQQQNGNLQYITTLNSDTEFKQPTQYLTPNPLVPGTFQLHTDQGNLLALSNGGISVLPNMQLAQSQPTVLGTIIQPQTSSLQCGMVSEQLLLQPAPLEMVTDASGCMYLTSQPVYYGLETIVQNTVMQSQQFVSTAMQGMLSSNSSFSATTTQVFQASKIEPIVEVPAGYVVVNNMPSDNMMQQSQPNLIQTIQGNTDCITNIPGPSGVQSNTLPLQFNNFESVQLDQKQIQINANTSKNNINLQTSALLFPKVQNQIINKVPPSNKPQQIRMTMDTDMKVNKINTKDMIQQIHFGNKNQIFDNSQIVTAAQNNMQFSQIHFNKQTSPIVAQGTIIVDKPTVAQKSLGQLCKSVPEQISHALAPKVKELAVPTTKVIKNAKPGKSNTHLVQPIQCKSMPLLNADNPPNRPLLVMSNAPSTTKKQRTNKIQNQPIIQNPNAQCSHKIMGSNIQLSNTMFVQPIQQVSSNLTSTTPARPMNRVLPMQTSMHKENSNNKAAVSSPSHQTTTPEVKIKPVQTSNCEAKIQDKEIITIHEDRNISNKIYQKPVEELPRIDEKTYKNSSETLNKQTNSIIDMHIPLKSLNENMKPKPLTEKSVVYKFNNIISIPTEVAPVTLIPPKRNRKPKVSIRSKENDPKIIFEIHSQDGFDYTSNSISDLWGKVLESVQQARKNHGLSPLPQESLKAQLGFQTLGLDNNALRYLLEQLPGANKCVNYKHRYHKPQAGDLDYDNMLDVLKENATGAIRCETYKDRSEYDMFSWLASRHRQRPLLTSQTDSESAAVRRASSTNLPLAMRFRYLKETSKESVGVFRSLIHGRGLFCRRDIELGEMVIEYAGEVIRATLTDKREKYYDGKGIGCYMFRIDDQFVVDATMRGNAARFINHSCEPNCYSKVIDVLGHKHIVIFALRRILQGEELTYDYKFPFEDVKIPCTCGSRKCRKYLN